MPDELETILRLVAEGHLTADAAVPILDALRVADRTRLAAAEGSDARSADASGAKPGGGAGRASASAGAAIPGAGRRMRIQVRDRGQSVVDIRVPLTLAGLATESVPGLSEIYRDRIRQALDHGIVGPILEIRDEDGDGGVRIVVE